MSRRAGLKKCKSKMKIKSKKMIKSKIKSKRRTSLALVTSYS